MALCNTHIQTIHENLIESTLLLQVICHTAVVIVQDFVSGEAGGVSLAQVEERMFELVCTSHLNHMTFLEVCSLIQSWAKNVVQAVKRSSSSYTLA